MCQSPAAAHAGPSPDELFHEGVAFAGGTGGMPRDDHRAFLRFREAAEAGHAKAQHDLALMCAEGRGTPQDDKEALGWFLRAADQGLAPSEEAAGKFLLAGRGCEKDARRAAALWEKAAAQDFVAAEADLAQLSFFGADDFPKANDAAFKWASKAASAGDVPSQNLLGFLYESRDGNGAGSSAKQSLWYQRAAEAGDAKAQASLGQLYMSGNGAERDLVQAYVWLSLSAAQKEATGSVILDELKRGMSPVEIEAAEKALRERQR